MNDAAPHAAAMHSYEPAAGHGLKHDPFNAIIGPRPIGWISSVGADGVVNLAPYSFFNAFNYHPPIIGFSSIGWKDSVANIKETGEFVWNLATRAIAEQMNATSATVPREIDEFDLGHLTKLASTNVAPPRVAESPVHFECKLTQLLQLHGHDGKAIDTWMVFGEVVAVHIDASLIEGGVYQTAKPHPILRAGRWGDYAEINPDVMFVMARPNPPSF
jgi:flavin reductase (DIM6/NTAB) family NADH-FMN oxidoreductase RutF